MIYTWQWKLFVAMVHYVEGVCKGMLHYKSFWFVTDKLLDIIKPNVCMPSFKFPDYWKQMVMAPLP